MRMITEALSDHRTSVEVNMSMDKGCVRIFCGEGKGKSDAALGTGLERASQGLNVFVIQFMKGKYSGSLEYLKRMEPELKIFRFEKENGYYEDLPEASKKEENQNMINGLHYARKVLTIGECDVLILDEVLGLIDAGIIGVDEVLKLIDTKSDEVELILTGRHLAEEVAAHADYISEINILKNQIV